MGPLKNALHERVAQEVVKDPRDKKRAGIRAGLSKKTASQSVSRILARKEVDARIREIQGAGARRAVATAETIADQLDEDRNFARKRGQAGAMVQASMGKAKVLGIIVDKSMQVTKRAEDMTEAELAAFLGET